MSQTSSLSEAKRIFIVYDSHESELAEALSKLLRQWGLNAFYCRQEERKSGGATYRRHLANKLKEANAVILLLSREFAWSPYCQSEAGATMTIGLKALPITIPPMGVDQISSISPVLEGLDAIAVPVVQPMDEQNQFFTDLRAELEDRLDSGSLSQGDYKEESSARRAVIKALTRITDDYRSNTPSKALMSIWPSIDDLDGNARDSIISNIKASLASGEFTTSLAFVGVSLKYSMPLITKALAEFADEVKKNKHERRTQRSPKELTLELVHMDANSHILHSLDDTIDIKSIYTNFHVEWTKTCTLWAKYCKASHITLAKPIVHEID